MSTYTPLRQAASEIISPLPRLLVSMVFFHSSPLPGYSIVLVLLWVALDHCAQAQNFTFIDTLLGALDQFGLTNFTSVVRQVNADPAQITFSLSLSDSTTPKTLFIPSNDAFVNPNTNAYDYSYRGDDTGFLSALLLYHLAPGQYLQEDLGAGPNHTIIPTTLQGHGMSFLESDQPQVLALGSGANGIEIYNQRQTTAVVETLLFEHVTLHIVNAIIGIPASYSVVMKSAGLKQFEAMRTSAAVPSLDDLRGFTMFAPTDDAISSASSRTLSTSLVDVWNNHVIMGQTVWFSGFEQGVYTAVSGLDYQFSINNGPWNTVTLNGVTANILRSDYLTNNGVVHIIDQVFANVADPVVPSSTSTPSTSAAVDTPPLTASASTSPASTSSTTSCSPDASSSCPTGNQGPASRTSGSAINPGVIVGIVAVLLIALLAPLLVFVVWKRREAKRRRFRMMPEAMSPFDDLPTAALRLTPFHPSCYDTESGEWSYPPSRSSRGGSRASIALPPAAVRTSHEKKASLPDLPTGETTPRGVQNSSAPPDTAHGLPIRRTLMVGLVDYITQQVAQRMDPASAPPLPPGPNPEQDAPPLYSSPPARIPSAIERQARR